MEHPQTSCGAVSFGEMEKETCSHTLQKATTPSSWRKSPEELGKDKKKKDKEKKEKMNRTQDIFTIRGRGTERARDS